MYVLSQAELEAEDTIQDEAFSSYLPTILEYAEARNMFDDACDKDFHGIADKLADYLNATEHAICHSIVKRLHEEGFVITKKEEK